MVSKDAVYTQLSNFDRMGALAKWIAAKAEEMSQLDRRIDRRIEHLQRAEENLRSLFEALREQVATAHSVSDDLNKKTGGVDDHQQKVDEMLQQTLEKVNRLSELADARTKQLEEATQMIVQNTDIQLDQLLQRAREANAPFAAQVEQQVAQQSRFENITSHVQIDFEQKTAEVVEAIRRSATEQIERLASQAAVAVDPVLARVDAHRQKVEAQLNAAVTAAEQSLRHRAEELCRSGDAVVDSMEQRLARRLENIRPKTAEVLEAAEKAMNQHLGALLEGARLNVSTTEAELADRINQLRPNLSKLLQTVNDDLVDQVSRLEEHAFSMTGWLEKRMTDRVDALIARTRSALSQTPTVAAQPLSPEATSFTCYADEYPAPAAPNAVDVQVFVDRKSDRPHRSSNLSIFK
jgi:ElaB/YqjD/DUF883 family membrane-anchored ribosome-binding protein